MKTLILTIFATLCITAAAAAQTSDTVTVRPGQQKTASHSRIRVKFISVTEDSRCPADVACVWAGNAKIQVKVSDRNGSKIIVMNTMGQSGDQFGSYAITLNELTPKRRSNGNIKPKDYRATITVTRLAR